MSNPRKYIFLISIAAIFFVTGLFFLFLKEKRSVSQLPPAKVYEEAVREEAKISQSGEKKEAETGEIKETALPAEVNLKIPFTSQAPHQNWDLPYKEFCEEASALMAVSYVKNQPILGPDDADAKMLEIKRFEEKKFGVHEDTTAAETALIIREHFGVQATQLVDNPTAKDIRTALAKGKAVIVPLAGQQIGNPYYHQPGPVYHMLVIKGYKKNGDFITNDPGTRRGADFVYEEKTIMDAIHDWNPRDINKGKKVLLIVG